MRDTRDIENAVGTKDIDKLQERLKKGREDLDHGLKEALYLLQSDTGEFKDNAMTVVSSLLDAKANPNGLIVYQFPNTQEKEIPSFLTYAINIMHLDLVKLLIDKKASLQPICTAATRKDHSRESLITAALTVWTSKEGKTENERLEINKKKALIAWHLFTIGVPLWEKPTVAKIIKCATFANPSYPFYSASFIFLTALNSLWIKENFIRVTTSTLIIKNLISDVVNIIIKYVGMDHEAIGQEIVEFKKPKDTSLLEAEKPPLLHAAINGQLAQVKQLLKAKASPADYLKDNSILMWAVQKSNSDHASAAIELMMENLGNKPPERSCTISRITNSNMLFPFDFLSSHRRCY